MNSLLVDDAVPEKEQQKDPLKYNRSQTKKQQQEKEKEKGDNKERKTNKE